MNERPIGVFDSGLGGLTAVKQLRKILPGENIVYFGDTGRVPYGARSPQTIIRYTRQDIAFLLSRDVKTVLAACGTVSSTFPQEEGEKLPVGYTGVVAAAAQAALDSTRNGIVGIIGTEATVASGSYQKQLAAHRPDIQTVADPCPLFVPLVEYGYTAPENPMAQLAVAEYLEPIKKAGADTVILGCTHYPLLKGAIGAYMGPDVVLIDPGKEAALLLSRKLEQQGLLSSRSEGGTAEYYVSDEPDRFEHFARLFLGEQGVDHAQKVAIDHF